MQEITPSVLNSTSHTKPGQFPDELASPQSELFSKFLITICTSLTVEDPITGFGSLGRVSKGLVRWSPSQALSKKTFSLSACDLSHSYLAEFTQEFIEMYNENTRILKILLGGLESTCSGCHPSL